jgi:hypothetical protein
MLDLADYTALRDHSLMWGIYLAAAFVVLLAYWGVTRRWWFELRWLLFALLAAFLLVPAPVPGRDMFAPAMIMAVLSPFTGTPELIAAVLVRLLLGAISAVVLVILISIARRVYLRHR